MPGIWSTQCSFGSRASRDFLEEDAEFSLQVGRMAIQQILEGHGYDLTSLDFIEACNHFLKAGEKLRLVNAARGDTYSMATSAEQNGSPFASILLRRYSPGS